MMMMATTTSSEDELKQLIGTKGDEIRELKVSRFLSMP